MTTNNLYFYVLLLMLLGRSDGNGNTCISDNCITTLLIACLIGSGCMGNTQGCGCGCGCN